MCAWVFVKKKEENKMLPAFGVLPTMGSPYVIRRFEPAFMTPMPTFAVLPFSPATIAAVSPVMYGPADAAVIEAASRGAATVRQAEALGSGAGAAAATAAATIATIPGAPCGSCCNRSYSPLPPNAVQAWGSNVGCGGSCSPCQTRWWF